MSLKAEIKEKAEKIFWEGFNRGRLFRKRKRKNEKVILSLDMVLYNFYDCFCSTSWFISALVLGCKFLLVHNFSYILLLLLYNNILIQVSYDSPGFTQNQLHFVNFDSTQKQRYFITLKLTTDLCSRRGLWKGES